MSDLFSKINPVVKYDGKNFSAWKAKLEAYLKAIDKYNVVTANRPRRILQGEETAIRERDQQIQVFLEEDRTVRSILLLSLEDKYCLMVQNLDTSKAVSYTHLTLPTNREV